MNQHLKQAIAAAHAGKEAQAKVLLARVIKDEPDNVNAWFLLSSLADTEEQKVQHLEKVLELQPGHAAATQQLAELAPQMPEVVEEEQPETPEAEEDASPEMFPLPEVDLPEEDTAPEDPDEAMAWLERLAADQGAPIDELPSISDESVTADTLLEIPSPVSEDIEASEETEQPELEEDTAPEDPEEAMAWLERLAADQGAPVDELPSISEEDIEETLAVDDLEDLSWLEGVDGDDDDYLESLPTLVDEVEETMPDEPEAVEEAEEETAEPTQILTVSDDSVDLVSQAECDSIPSWLADDEALISADTLITEPVAEVEETAEPENLPDWLNELPPEDWAGEEAEGSGQVIWKPGEGDESLKPEPPSSKDEAVPEKTAEPRDNTNLYLALLVIIAIILVFAILFLMFG